MSNIGSSGSYRQVQLSAARKTFYAEAAIPADAFARVVAFAISQPEDMDVNEVVFQPTRQEL
jgi:NADP-dependent 3-hydroxy acid dehydrogenase YdfG